MRQFWLLKSDGRIHPVDDLPFPVPGIPDSITNPLFGPDGKLWGDVVKHYDPNEPATVQISNLDGCGVYASFLIGSEGE